MEQYAQESKQVIQTPDFSNIVENLRKENSIYTDLSNKAFQITKTIKSFPDIPQKCEEVAPYKEPITVIDHLWLQVEYLRKTNLELTTILNHLQSVVGS